MCLIPVVDLFFFSSRRRHTRCLSDWSSDVCSSDLCNRASAAVWHDAPKEPGARPDAAPPLRRELPVLARDSLSTSYQPGGAPPAMRCFSRPAPKPNGFREAAREMQAPTVLTLS